MSRPLLLAAFCAVLPLAARADVTVAGSDLLQPALQKYLDGARGAEARTVRLHLAGSRSGLAELRAGRADLAVLAFAPGEALPAATEVRLIPLAYQVAVLIVNDDCPVRQLDFTQLAGLFGDKEGTNLRQWGALGGTGPWAEKSIGLGTAAAADSLMLALFRHTVLTTPQLKSTVLEHPTVDELLLKVRIDDSFVGLVPRAVRPVAGVRVLLIARNQSDVPFGPTPDNIHNGDYPLRLPFYLALRPQRAAALAPVVALLLGDEAAAEFDRAGYVPVPANARGEARRSLGVP